VGQDWGQVYWRWLTQDALPLWASHGVDHVHGGFHELLGADGLPVSSPRRARVQGRQSFVFAHAGRLGWDGPWRDCATVGLDYLERHYRRADGLYATLAGADGGVLDATAMTYDQAFALLAAAALHAHEAARWEDYALTLLARIEALRRHKAGGFVEADGRCLSNPHMHLLEAALAWMETGRDPAWEKLAAEIVALALAHFIDPEKQVLREVFDAAWSPAQGEDGLVTEPGHQFEWSWLLERWSRMKNDTRTHDAARMLFAAGTRGVDAARNVALDETDPDMMPRRATARLWPQTERLKAALLLGEDDEARAAAQSLWRYLETPKPGLWRDKMRADGSFVEESSPASSLYHIICAAEALRSHGALTSP
jgi:mannose-1-phosphate guanylyltransferase/mannose-6-phosphate isomerase